MIREIFRQQLVFKKANESLCYVVGFSRNLYSAYVFIQGFGGIGVPSLATESRERKKSTYPSYLMP